MTFLLPRGVLASPPSSGDWVVNGTESYRDQVIELNGNLIIEGGGNLTFRNVTLKLNCAYDGQYGIQVKTGGSFYVLEGSVITAVDPSYEYYFSVGSTFRMNHSELHESGYEAGGMGSVGLTIESTDDAIVENSLISNNWVGIMCYWASPIIRNNNISSNANTGICLGNSNATIEGNHLENNDGADAILLMGSSPIIRANTITGNNGVGIRCIDYSNPTILSNVITNNAWYGIECGTHSSPTIQGNNISLNGGVGVYCWNYSSPTISNNVITNNDGHGIQCDDHSNPTIEDNIITSNRFNGIYCFNYSNPTIRSNILTSNGAHAWGSGISCDDHCSPTIQNNTLTNHPNCGITAHSYSNPLIKENDITSNTQWGIQCDTYSSPIIQGNKIALNNFSGIICSGYSNPIVQGNEIMLNRHWGITCQNGSRPEIHWNDIINDEVGNEDPNLVINATYNYWSSPEGPEVGKEVSANVTYNPWLNESIIVVGITYPLQGAMVSGVVTVAVDARAIKGISAVRFYLDDTLTHTDYDSPYQWSWNTSHYVEASHELRAVAQGILGCKRMAAVTVAVDNTLPAGKITSPKMGAYVSGTCPISLFGSDANFEAMQLYVDEDLMETWYSGGNRTYNWKTGAYSDGGHAIKLMIRDKAGNNRTVSIPVTVDNTVPTTEILTPTEGTLLTGKYNATFTFYDVNLLNATLKVDGKIYDVTNNAWFLLNTTELTEGSHRITLIAIDKAGNRAEKGVTVILDHTRPAVGIKSPVDNAKLHGTVMINWTASDANLRWIRLIIENFVYDVTAATSFPLNTTMLKDGNYTIMIMAIDGAGNYATASIRVLIDNTPPAVSIESPADRATVSLRLVIAVGASDFSGVSKVDFYINNVLSFTKLETPYRWEWDTTQYDNGEYTIRVVAFDMVGLTSSRQITVTVQNVKVPWWQERALEIIGTIAAIGALIVAILERKRKH